MKFGGPPIDRLCLDADDDLATFGELHGVVAEIEEHLAQPQRIADERIRNIGVGIEKKLDPLSLGLDVYKASYIIEHVVEPEVRGFHREFAGLDLREVEDVVDDAHQILGGAMHLFDIIPLPRVKAGLKGETRHAENSIHRGPDLVRHVREEVRLRRRGRFRHLLGRRQDLFDLLLRIEVHVDADQPFALAVHITLDTPGDVQDPFPFAAFRFHAQFAAVFRGLPGQVILARLPDAVEIIGMDERLPAPGTASGKVSHLVGRVSEHFGPDVVDDHFVRVDTQVPEAQPGAFQGHVEPFAAFHQLVLGRDLVRDVLGDTVHVGRPADAVPDEESERVDPHDPAVGGAPVFIDSIIFRIPPLDRPLENPVCLPGQFRVGGFDVREPLSLQMIPVSRIRNVAVDLHGPLRRVVIPGAIERNVPVSRLCQLESVVGEEIRPGDLLARFIPGGQIALARDDSRFSLQEYRNQRHFAGEQVPVEPPVQPVESYRLPGIEGLEHVFPARFARQPPVRLGFGRQRGPAGSHAQKLFGRVGPEHGCRGRIRLDDSLLEGEDLQGVVGMREESPGPFLSHFSLGYIAEGHDRPDPLAEAEDGGRRVIDRERASVLFPEYIRVAVDCFSHMYRIQYAAFFGRMGGSIRA
ncbi:MAG: hypothetical protein BWY66_00964 [bacterium ADurb.Bin374]|nr:MAG: hypothetical protein BWY66_00964 [bacterium ADurb.Bin374]